MAVRGALGATRFRLVRQLATESLVLAAAGGAIGVFLAWVGTVALTRLNLANLPRLDAVRIDSAVLLFAVAATALTALASGLLPALGAAEIDLNRVLRAGSGAIAPAHRRGLLMVAEMALALVLLIGAGLTIRSFAALQGVRPGFDPAGLLTFRIALPPAKYPRPELRTALLKEMERRLRAIPGVADVGLVSQLPLTGSGPLSPFAYDEVTARRWESETSDGRNVSPAYFRTMGTRLIAGRPFDDRDYGRQDVIIVDETLAARAWRGSDPIGKRLQVQPTGNPNAFAEVVGVIEHMRAHDLSRAVRPQIYSPLGGGGRVSVVVRAAADPGTIVSAVRGTMHQVDPDLPLDRVRPMAAYVADALAESRLNLILMSLFGGAALLLSSVGIYGVFSYTVGQRTREIGIRMALGQAPDGIRNLVLKEAVVLIVKSTVLGLGAAFLLGRAVSSLLYQITPDDPATFAAGTLVLTTAALAGCYLPARRATAVSPIVALKTD
jgi:putative ABC transport system permease protein